MHKHVVKLTLHTVGPLVVRAQDGSDRTPKGRKAQALLALLALAPGHRRARSWLRDKLWSNRGFEQGAASLRQTLAEIRRALRDASTCLLADRFVIALDQEQVAVVRHAAPTLGGAVLDADETELFEGLEVRDPKFEAWIREQRSKLAFLRNIPIGPDSPTSQLHGPSPPTKPTLQLVLLPQPQTTLARGCLVADTLIDLVAKTIKELGTIDVLDYRRHAPERRSGLPGVHSEALALEAEAVEDRLGTAWRIVLTSACERRVMYSAGGHNNTPLNPEDPAVLLEVNQVVDAALNNFLAMRANLEPHAIATLLCRQGIRTLFRLGREDLLEADRLFARAFELEPRGLYLAWRGYLRTFLLAERLTGNRQRVVDEAIEYMRRALELEPNNSYVASLSAHVNYIVSRSYVVMYELAARSVQLNRGNPMGWACLGTAECHLGNTRDGLAHTLHASNLARTTSFNFHINALACIASSMAGDFERSIALGEAAHGLAPAFRPPLRYLSALYLISGERDRSREAVEKLKVLEPDFSYQMLRDSSYPAAGLRSSKLLERIPARQI